MPYIIPYTQLDYHLLKLGFIDIRLPSGRRGYRKMFGFNTDPMLPE
jgi:hypothetical protein